MRLNLTRAQMNTRGGSVDAVLEALPQPAVLVDECAGVRYVNRQAARLWPPVHAQEREIQREDARKMVLQAIKTGSAQVGTLEMIPGYPGLSSVLPVAEQEQIIGALCIALSGPLAMVKEAVSQLNPSQQAGGYYDALARLTSRAAFEQFIGDSPEARAVMAQCRLAAKSPYSILIVGESGCGKGLLAGAIHAENPQRTTTPFIKINCAAFPAGQLETILFGREHEADVQQGGLERAERGTVYLEEVGELSPALQDRLLRVLKERVFVRMGGSEPHPLRARVIAASSRDLHQAAEQGTFRADLYYRLSILEIRIPPLRERRSDIPRLAGRFSAQCEPPFSLTDDAYGALMEAPWPGNVRQLKAAIRQLASLRCPEPVSGAVVRQVLSAGREAVQDAYAVPRDCTVRTLAETEAACIRGALKQCGGNLVQTAKVLGIGRSTLYSKLKKHGIRVGRPDRVGEL